MSTVPSGVEKVAATGHTLTQGGFWHCWHGVGMNCVPPPGRSPSNTWIHSIGSGGEGPPVQGGGPLGGAGPPAARLDQRPRQSRPEQRRQDRQRGGADDPNPQQLKDAAAGHLPPAPRCGRSPGALPLVLVSLHALTLPPNFGGPEPPRVSPIAYPN